MPSNVVEYTNTSKYQQLPMNTDPAFHLSTPPISPTPPVPAACPTRSAAHCPACPAHPRLARPAARPAVPPAAPPAAPCSAGPTAHHPTCPTAPLAAPPAVAPAVTPTAALAIVSHLFRAWPPSESHALVEGVGAPVVVTLVLVQRMVEWSGWSW